MSRVLQVTAADPQMMHLPPGDLVLGFVINYPDAIQPRVPPAPIWALNPRTAPEMEPNPSNNSLAGSLSRAEAIPLVTNTSGLILDRVR